MHTEVGLFEAKAKLSELVRKASMGERITITVRGQALADLVPSQNARAQAAKEAAERLRNGPRIQGVTPEMIREWIEEGRK